MKITKKTLPHSVGQALFGEAFFAAAAKGDQKTIETTLEACPNALDWKNGENKTALDIAEAAGNGRLSAYLKNKGSPPSH